MSRPDQALYLIGTTITMDSIGNQVQTPTQRMIYGEELYVGSNEFYNAAAAGLKAERRYEIYAQEYGGEARIKCGGITYRIIRTAPGKTPGKLWLTCERVAADG